MNKDFNTVEDFVADESFQNFCIGYQDRNTKEWQRYIDRHPEKLDLIEEARMMVTFLHVPAKVAPIENVKPIRQGKNRKALWSVAVVACLILVTGLLMQQWVKNSSIPQEIVIIKGGQSTPCILPDQSTVLLREGATLSWMSPWTRHSKRELWLEGEAYFDVRKNPSMDDKTFQVHLQKNEYDTTALTKGTITVLGTRFLVRPEEEALTILLEEGKIVYQSQDSDYVMKPGDQLYQTKKSIAIQQDVSIKDYMLWSEKKISFSDQSIESVIRQLNRSFDLEISIGNKRIKNKKITASIAEPNPYLLLEAIATIYDIKIVKKGDQIILK